MVDRQNEARHDFRILQVDVGMLKEEYPRVTACAVCAITIQSMG